MTPFGMVLLISHLQSFHVGEVSEWFMELVLKTSDPARDQEFESLPLRQILINTFYMFTINGEIPKW